MNAYEGKSAPDQQVVERGLPNRGRLKNGNPGGDLSKVPRCGAKRRCGLPCKALAMRSRVTGEYTRCRVHGGSSTGPKTAEGLARTAHFGKANGSYSNGNYTAAAMAEQAKRTAKRRSIMARIKEIERLARTLRRS